MRGLSRNGKYINNKGSVLLFNPDSSHVKWVRKVNFSNSGFGQFNNHFISANANKSIYVNPENGADKWSLPNEIYYVHPRQNIALGYRYKAFSGNFGNTLEGIDINTGTVLWKRELKKDYGWNDVVKLNDSTLLITSSGIHLLNLKDGKGWNYEAQTGRNDYKNMIATNVAGIALGILTGSYVYSVGRDVVKDLVSNLLKEEGNFYLASRNEIVKIDSDGNKLWQKELVKEYASKSNLFIKGDNLIMINRGYAYFNNNLVDYGTPFIAVFDKNTGEQKFLKETGKKKEVINSYTLHKDSSAIDLVMKNKLASYSLESGMLINEKIFNTKEYGEPNHLINDKLYLKPHTDFEKINEHYKNNHILITKNDKVVLLDKEFNAIDEIESKDLYFTLFENNGQKFLIRGQDIILIDANNKILAELKISPKATIVNNKLYDIQDNKLLEINLADFSSSM